MNTGTAPGKRKFDSSDNPLLNATTVKKSKKGHLTNGNPNNKRKLFNGEEQPGGLVIVRPSSSQLEVLPTPKAQRSKSNQPTSQPQPGPSYLQSLQPPNKKFRATSQPPSDGKALSRALSGTPDPAIERDVRQMEDEANNLRRQAHAQSFLTYENTSQATEKGKFKDISLPLPSAATESPLIARNKRMREPSMAAIRAGQNEDESITNGPAGSKHGHNRRSSLSGRGKRVSDIFETTGLITHPHNSVSSASFYKHIDSDLSDTERIRQLLIWSLSRATSRPSTATISSPHAKTLLRNTQDLVIRRLAEKRIEISTPPSTGVKENPQNVSNRKWLEIYGADNDRAETEDRKWKELQPFYDRYLSDKAKGKRKAEDIDDDEMRWASEVLKKDSALNRQDAVIKQRTRDVEFQLDTLATYVSVAWSTAEAARAMLDERFAVLSRALNLWDSAAPEHETGAQLSTYIGSGAQRSNPRELLHALASIDGERPPAQVGDAARRATREVRRVEEKGITPIGERRLTMTPSKQRPTTPRRERTPGRER